MKAKSLNKNKRLIEMYCLNYALKYLRCLITQAQIEQIILTAHKNENILTSNKLLKLNLKHNRLVKKLFDQKNKIENCA